MSAMTNYNSTPNYLFSAPERELLTLSSAEIIDGLKADYESFCRGNDAGVRVPDKMQEPRMAHSCILFAEGLRLAKTHLEQAKKLILASLFDCNIKIAGWFADENGSDGIWAVLKKVEDNKELAFEDELLLFRVFGFNARSVIWLAAHGNRPQLEEVFKAIEDYEAFKREERNKKEDKNQ